MAKIMVDNKCHIAGGHIQLRHKNADDVRACYTDFDSRYWRVKKSHGDRSYCLLLASRVPAGADYGSAEALAELAEIAADFPQTTDAFEIECDGICRPCDPCEKDTSGSSCYSVWIDNAHCGISGRDG